ncbi:hypothetical protein K402DRAFT_264472 [Aulographum hederae CBS 113979]|uniref:Uncharacterized protein n=1 Tax=Aulographum hederae CBS 113979 TaxID=1176131 RepID=A0A6G1H9V3_9PEZI|nr:hypothetical protein K402DRAFT_264472 [Aulographum hederae CBS 113979]
MARLPGILSNRSPFTEQNEVASWISRFCACFSENPLMGRRLLRSGICCDYIEVGIHWCTTTYRHLRVGQPSLALRRIDLAGLCSHTRKLMSIPMPASVLGCDTCIRGGVGTGTRSFCIVLQPILSFPSFYFSNPTPSFPSSLPLPFSPTLPFLSSPTLPLLSSPTLLPLFSHFSNSLLHIPTSHPLFPSFHPSFFFAGGWISGLLYFSSPHARDESLFPTGFLTGRLRTKCIVRFLFPVITPSKEA